MLRGHAKAVVLALLLVVLAAEAYLTHRWYDRYHELDAGNIPAVAATSMEAASRADRGADETRRSEPADDTDFLHTATDGNSRGDFTYLDDPRLNGDPSAIVLATPLGKGAEDDSYGHNIGVWYEGQKGRWAIFNQDLAPVPAGSTFRVHLPPASGGFVHRAAAASIEENSTHVDDPLVNGRPGADVSVTQNWNPGGRGGVYNDHPVGISYDEEAGGWVIQNRDGARMPDGAAFNIAVPDAAETGR